MMSSMSETGTGAAEAAEPSARPSPPGDLLLVQELVNSFDVEANTDEIREVARLGAWLTSRGLVSETEAGALGAPDVVRVANFREALRGLLRVNHGEQLDAAAAAVLHAEASRPLLCVHIDADGSVRLTPSGEGVDRVVARLLAAIAQGDVEGSWRRLKVCADDTCAVAFYDSSRNASRAWCSMAVCGNRAKARRHRRRASTAAD
jgi:predicted RNA-binding Zn ribbon-like protein